MGVLLVGATDTDSIPVSGIELAPESRRSLMPVPGDQHDQKTCLQIYNPAGFSIEFAMVRNTPAALRFPTFSSRWVRGAAAPPISKPQPFSVGAFFLPDRAGFRVLVRVPAND
jgi:hypothetical protein